MTANAVTQAPTYDAMTKKTYEFLASGGDARSLSQAERNAYYRTRCELAGLDPATVPFQWINLSGKLVLYALKSATDMLAGKHKVHLEILSQVTETDDMRVVTVRAKTADGHATDEVGTVDLGGKKGEARANLMLKAVTKAKRRAIISLLGLGMLDETEVETIPGAKPFDPVKVEQEAQESLALGESNLNRPFSEEDERKAEAEALAATEAREAKKITTKQARALWAHARGLGLPDEVLRRRMEAMGYGTTSDVRVADYEGLRTWCEEQAAGPADPAPAAWPTAGPRVDDTGL